MRSGRPDVPSRGTAMRSPYILALVLLAAACAPHAPTTAGTTPTPRPAGLPPIPEVSGPLRIDVVAPGENEELPTRDSTFVYGSLGTGRATLSIDGAAVRVEPNGSFLAWLPAPADGVYHLTAGAGGQTQALERRVRLPSEPPSLPPDRARILEGTVHPTGAWVVQPGERIDVGFRGTPGARAWLVLPDGTRLPLVASSAVDEVVEDATAFSEGQSPAPRLVPGVSAYSGFFIARPLRAATPDTDLRLTSVPMPAMIAPPAPAPDTLQAPRSEPRTSVPKGKKGKKVSAETQVVAERHAPRETADRPAEPPRPTRNANGLVGAASAGAAVLELVAGTDTARAPLPLSVAVMERPRVGVAAPAAPDQTHRGEVVGRATPSGPYNWFWPAGTRFALRGERNGMFRVALANNRSAWVSASEVRLLPEGTPPPYSRVGTVRFRPQAGWIDVRLALSQSLPFKVDETPSSITISLYGAQSATNFMQYGPVDPLVRYAEWRQLTDSIFTLTVNLTQDVWGYQTYFAPDGNLVLRIRRPPHIDPAHPLRGLRIMLDPGHPPAGATGPTRLAEKDANLWIALRLRPLLEQQGATVLMTRTTDVAVPLNVRPQMAVDQNADILLSIHNNGLPNGVNPFGNTGTSDYYFHPRAAELAQDLDREIVRELGTLDLGTGRADLALVRPPWMPAVLTETMYLMVPQQEAALRNPTVQQRVAEAHLRGLEAFLRSRAREQH